MNHQWLLNVLDDENVHFTRTIAGHGVIPLERQDPGSRLSAQASLRAVVRTSIDERARFASALLW